MMFKWIKMKANQFSVTFHFTNKNCWTGKKLTAQQKLRTLNKTHSARRERKRVKNCELPTHANNWRWSDFGGQEFVEAVRSDPVSLLRPERGPEAEINAEGRQQIGQRGRVKARCYENRLLSLPAGRPAQCTGAQSFLLRGRLRR